MDPCFAPRITYCFCCFVLPSGCTASGSSQLDLVCVFDSSSNVFVAGWNQLLSFANAVNGNLQIGSSATQVAVVVFGDNATTAFRLNRYPTSASLTAAVRGLPFLNSLTTDLNDALYLIWSDVFGPGGGWRPNASRVALVVTDGVDNKNKEMTMGNDTLCKQNRVRLITVGVSSDINRTRLIQVASNPKDFYNVSGYSSLMTVLGSLASVLVCPSVPNSKSSADRGRFTHFFSDIIAVTTTGSVAGRSTTCIIFWCLV